MQHLLVLQIHGLLACGVDMSELLSHHHEQSDARALPVRGFRFRVVRRHWWCPVCWRYRFINYLLG